MKRVALVVSLVGVAGCTKNHAELKATQVTRDIALRENAALKREVKRLQRQVGVAQ